MCGIFGAVASASLPPTLVATLAQANTVRGNRAFGVVTWTRNRCAVIRHLGPWTDRETPDAEVVLCHVRAPTNGRDALQTTHPFETPEFLLAHNGIFLNPETIVPSLAYTGPEVDSMALVHGIDKHLRQGASVAEAIATTAALLDGQQACWLWHKREEALYLWRVMSTLFWSSCESNRFVFSSASVEEINAPLSEGHVHRVTPTSPRPIIVASFEYYSPYLIPGAELTEYS
jgi:glucosamine 6-phosphate synthetase-like amidotransferase/phosphosugar isomerase protein